MWERRDRTAERLAFACARLAGFALEGTPDVRAQKWKALASRLTAAVPALRTHGVAFAVISWLGGRKEEPSLASWCCLWFAESPSMKRLVPPPPKGAMECVKWLLEREPAELRFVQRETEALVEQLKNLAKGYELELAVDESKAAV